MMWKAKVATSTTTTIAIQYTVEREKTNSKTLNGAHHKIKHAKRSSIRVEMQGLVLLKHFKPLLAHMIPMNICINLLLGNRKRGRESESERASERERMKRTSELVK